MLARHCCDSWNSKCQAMPRAIYESFKPRFTEMRMDCRMSGWTWKTRMWLNFGLLCDIVRSWKLEAFGRSCAFEIFETDLQISIHLINVLKRLMIAGCLFFKQWRKTFIAVIKDSTFS
jgi:hypothetical protein